MQTEQSRSNLIVVLVEPRNPLNIGAAARAMVNFGFEHLRVVNPYEVAFREARSAIGAADVLQAASEYRTLPEAVADCLLVIGTTSLGHRELQHPLRRLQSGAPIIKHQMTSGTVALLFGSEKFGLSNNEMSHCHWLMRIPTVTQDRSMNLGQAVAICLYELVRDADSKTLPEIPHSPGHAKLATSAQTGQITQMLLDVLRRSGYIKPPITGSAENKLRRLIHRLNLSARDAPVLMGMLRQMLWKLDQS